MAAPDDSVLAGLPEAIRKKIGKTKQTRGAQPPEGVPYQNRVNRNGVAVVPYAFRAQLHPDGFENGYTIMVRPRDYFESRGRVSAAFDKRVVPGRNAFVYYETRQDWLELPPPAGWRPSETRGDVGEYIARIPATTSADSARGAQVVRGAPQGIRFFEYASTATLDDTVAQLAWLSWHTEGIGEVSEAGPSAALIGYLRDRGLGDLHRFVSSGALVVVADEFRTVCPLCRAPVKAGDLMTRMEQAPGREIEDLTVTEANLFHLEDLRPGEYNHKPYALAWGHHHCNTVARDRGVVATIEWMAEVVDRHQTDNP